MTAYMVYNKCIKQFWNMGDENMDSVKIEIEIPIYCSLSLLMFIGQLCCYYKFLGVVCHVKRKHQSFRFMPAI